MSRCPSFGFIWNYLIPFTSLPGWVHCFKLRNWKFPNMYFHTSMSQLILADCVPTASCSLQLSHNIFSIKKRKNQTTRNQDFFSLLYKDASSHGNLRFLLEDGPVFKGNPHNTMFVLFNTTNKHSAWMRHARVHALSLFSVEFSHYRAVVV